MLNLPDLKKQRNKFEKNFGRLDYLDEITQSKKYTEFQIADTLRLIIFNFKPPLFLSSKKKVRTQKNIEILNKDKRSFELLLKNRELIPIIRELDVFFFYEILLFLSQNSKDELIKVIASIQKGNFRNEELYFQLEFSRVYERDLLYSLRIQYETFKEFPSNPQDFYSIIIYDRIQKEINRTAQEALDIFHYLKKFVNSNRNQIVIGNLSYGEYFVVHPLKKLFDSINLRYASFKIPSSNPSITQNDESNLINIESFDDVFIVDGTIESISTNHENTTRFPFSFTKIYSFFKEKKNFNIVLWSKSFENCKKIELPNNRGGPQFIFSNNELAYKETKKNIFLISSTSSNQSGFFDDFSAFAFPSKIRYFNKFGFQEKNLDEVIEINNLKAEVMLRIEKKVLELSLN